MKPLDFKGKDYILNNIRFKTLRGKYLLTTDTGAWILLNKSAYLNLKNNKIKKPLFNLLEEKGIIITKNNIEKVVSDQRERLDFLFRGASLHIILPTLRCNHKCVYCHSAAQDADKKKFDMDKKTIDKTLDFIFQTPAKAITIEFQGGDALLRADSFKYTVQKAKKLNKKFNKDVYFALVTNLTIMDEKIMDFLKKEKVRICTSLDGPKKIHDLNRIYTGHTSSYDAVTKNLRLLKKNKIPVSTLMVTTKHSLPHWKGIIDEYAKWGFTSIQLKYLNKLGFAKNTWGEIGYTVEEFLVFWKKAADYILELNKKGTYIEERYIKIILMKILSKKDPAFLDLRSPCGMVIGQMAYNHNGDIYSCDEGRNFELFKLGNVKKDTYKGILSSEKSQQLISSSINDILVCDNCIYKPYCGHCPVMNYAEEGNLIPKLPSNSKCRYHKFAFDYVFEKLLFDKEARKIFFSWMKKKTK